MKKYIFLIITTFASSILFNSCKKEKSVLAEAKFTFSGSLDEIPAKIQFTNNSFGISYVWDFGDGTSSNEKNPSHTYNEYGLYKVKLTAKGSNNIDTLVKDLLIGGNLGQIGSLNCSNFTTSTNFKIGKTYTNEVVQIPYTSGNGGVYNSFTVNSTGVLGLNATLNKGKFNSGDGNLELLISGSPTSEGNAKFKIDLVGKSCEFNFYVNDTIGKIDGLNCNTSFISTKFSVGKSYTNAIVKVPYKNGNGGIYNSLTINSTGVLGLTAKSPSMNLNVGDGDIELLISGTPKSKGSASFKIDLAGKSCDLIIVVLDTTANLPTNGLVGWWPFNGNANDESGNGNHGTIYGAVLTSDRNGNNSKSYLFNGTSNRIAFNLNSINNTFPASSESTSSIWIKTLDLNGPLISMQGNGGIEYDFHIGTLADVLKKAGHYGVLVRDNCCGTGNNTFASNCVDNSWHMLTIVRLSNGTLKLYKDAVLEFTSNSGQNGALAFNTTYMTFGAHYGWFVGSQNGCNSCNSNDQQHFSGKLDDIGIWNRALTQQEITDLYNLK